jgi:hypothetical protein
MLEVRPVGSKLYVKIARAAETRSGLLVVHKKQEWQEETLFATIVAIGPDCSYDELCVDQTVLIAGHAGKWVEPYITSDPEAMFRVIEQDDVIAYLEEVSDARESGSNESGGVQESTEPVSA